MLYCWSYFFFSADKSSTWHQKQILTYCLSKWINVLLFHVPDCKYFFLLVFVCCCCSGHGGLYWWLIFEFRAVFLWVYSLLPCCWNSRWQHCLTELKPNLQLLIIWFWQSYTIKRGNGICFSLNVSMSMSNRGLPLVDLD